MRAQCYFPYAITEELTPVGKKKRIFRMMAQAVNKTDAPPIEKKPKKWSLSWRPGQGWV